MRHFLIAHSDISKFHLNVVTEDHAKLLQHLGIDRAYMVGHDYWR